MDTQLNHNLDLNSILYMYILFLSTIIIKSLALFKKYFVMYSYHKYKDITICYIMNPSNIKCFGVLSKLLFYFVFIS